MIGVDVAIAFLVASALLAVAPGPDNLFVLAQSALHGTRAGLLVTLGLCTGLVGHTLAVALGIAAVIRTSALAFTMLKLVGAAYLAWLAWQAFRASGRAAASAKAPALSALRLYTRGVVMNVTNPKVAVFFLAFLPQFAEPAVGALVPQILTLGMLFIAVTLVVFGVIAAAAGVLGRWLAESVRAQRWLNRIAGCVFAALALRLASARLA